VVGLGIYLVVMIAVGVWASRFMGSLDDFALGGRRLGPWVTAISERASGESAWFLLGLPGAAYAIGFTEFWAVIGIAAGVLASWTLIAYPLRRATERMGALTLSEYFEKRFNDSAHLLRGASSAVILVFYTAYVAAQFVGAGKLFEGTFGLEPLWGILIGAIIVVVYTLAGGFLAVAWTDLIQGLLMAFACVVLPVLGIMALGGPGALIENLAARDPNLLTMTGGKTGQAFVFGVMVGSLSWGFGYLGMPHLLTRYMAIRKASEIRKGAGIAMSWVLIAYWGAMGIGLVGAALLGDDLADKEQVMPVLATTLLPGWLAGLIIAGAIAAMMSTADSQLLVAASCLVRDVWGALVKKGADIASSTQFLASRIATIGVAAVALGLALRANASGGSLIYDLVSFAWSGISSSFGPPLLLALYWKGTTRNGAFAGMMTGLLTTILWKVLPGKFEGLSSAAEILDVKFLSFVLAFVATWGVSKMGQRG
ncbi:MAG: sodium/proline symporter, partial [Acidobacteriota bacterium]